MENITLGEISIALIFMVSFIGAIEYFLVKINKRIEKILEPVKNEIKNVELSSLKADLTNFINDIEMGVFKTHIQKLNAREAYDRYIELGGDSYIHDHMEEIKKEGKL